MSPIISWAGKIEDAIDQVRQRPNDASSHLELGKAYYFSRQYQKAINAFEQVIRIKPDDHFAHYVTGASYAKMERYRESIPHYKEVIRIKPDYAPAHNELGLIYTALGQYKRAIISFKEAIRLEPNFEGTYSNLGFAYADNGQYQEAIFSFKERIRLQPNNSDAHYNLGIVYSKQNRHQEAIDSFKEAIRIKPDNHFAHNNLGFSYDELGRTKEAISEYKEALRIDSKYTVAKKNLKRAESKLHSRIPEKRGSFEVADVGDNDVSRKWASQKECLESYGSLATAVGKDLCKISIFRDVRFKLNSNAKNYLDQKDLTSFLRREFYTKMKGFPYVQTDLMKVEDSMKEDYGSLTCNVKTATHNEKNILSERNNTIAYFIECRIDGWTRVWIKGRSYLGVPSLINLENDVKKTTNLLVTIIADSFLKYKTVKPPEPQSYTKPLDTHSNDNLSLYNYKQGKRVENGTSGKDIVAYAEFTTLAMNIYSGFTNIMTETGVIDGLGRSYIGGEITEEYAKNQQVTKSAKLEIRFQSLVEKLNEISVPRFFTDEYANRAEELHSFLKKVPKITRSALDMTDQLFDASLTNDLDIYNSVDKKSRDKIIQALNLESSFMRLQNLNHRKTSPNYSLFEIVISSNDALVFMIKARITEFNESEFPFGNTNLGRNGSYIHIDSAKLQIKNTTSKINTGRQVLLNWGEEYKLSFSQKPQMKRIFKQAIETFNESFDVESSLNDTLAIMVNEFPSDEHYSRADIIFQALVQKRVDLALKRNQLVSQFYK